MSYFELGGGEDLIVFIYYGPDWDVFVLWELLGDDGDFTDVFVVAAEVFGYFREHLFPSFKDLRPEWIVHSEHLCSAGGVC